MKEPARARDMLEMIVRQPTDPEGFQDTIAT